jgi:hypothetical protein
MEAFQEIYELCNNDWGSAYEFFHNTLAREPACPDFADEASVCPYTVVETNYLVFGIIIGTLAAVQLVIALTIYAALNATVNLPTRAFVQKSKAYKVYCCKCTTVVFGSIVKYFTPIFKFAVRLAVLANTIIVIITLLKMDASNCHDSLQNVYNTQTDSTSGLFNYQKSNALANCIYWHEKCTDQISNTQLCTTGTGPAEDGDVKDVEDKFTKVFFNIADIDHKIHLN